MKTVKNKNRLNIFRMCTLGACFLGLIACNEVMEDTLKYDYSESGTNYESGHVLLVIVDGMSGRTIQQARNAYKAPYMKQMLTHALYTDYGLADGKRNKTITNERGWANLMLGTTAHNIVSEEELSANHSATEGRYPSFVELLSEKTNISMFASDQVFYDNFSFEGIRASKADNDEEVVQKVVEELTNTLNRPADLVIAELKGVNEAGEENGFYNDNGSTTEAVINAVEAVDKQISAMVETLKKRPQYKKENWLVIITSNYGGVPVNIAETSSCYEDITRNTFTLVYNDRLISTLQNKPNESSISYTFATPQWSYDYKDENPTAYVESAFVRNNTSLGELEFRKPMTFQFFIKSNTKTAESYAIISKSSNLGKPGNGWMLCFSNNNKIRLAMANGGNGVLTANRAFMNDGKWHVFTIVFAPHEKKEDAWNMTLYIDGVKDATVEKNKKHFSDYYKPGTGSENAPFRIGSSENREGQNKHSNTANKSFKNFFYITNLQIYDVALPEEFIAKNAGKNMLHKIDGYEYWDNLIAYWTCDVAEEEKLIGENGEYILRDHSKYASHDTDMVIDRGAKDIWLSGNSSDEALRPIPESDEFYYNKTFNTVDISRQICLWLGKTVNFSWNNQGKAWKLPFGDIDVNSSI